MNQDLNFCFRSANISGGSITVRADHEVKVSGVLNVTQTAITPSIITEQISSPSCKSPLKLSETEVSSINPNGGQLVIGGPVVFQNGLSISNVKCGNCESMVTITLSELTGDKTSLCLKCINDVVIHHQAYQNWLETNGDPLTSLRLEIAKLRQEVVDLKSKMK
jgi:hypothetical protein